MCQGKGSTYMSRQNGRFIVQGKGAHISVKPIGLSMGTTFQVRIHIFENLKCIQYEHII